MTALAVRLQQTSQELSARLQMLEQQAVAVQAPSIENKTQGMDTDKPALDAAAPMEEENAPTVPYHPYCMAHSSAHSTNWLYS